VAALAMLVLAGALAVPTALAQSARVQSDAPGNSRPVQLRAPRVVPLPMSDWDTLQRNTIAKYREPGSVGNAFATLLRIPALVDGIIPFHDYVTRDSSLPPRERELLILRTAWLLNNETIWAEHVPIARAAGFTSATLRNIGVGRDAPDWTSAERDLLSLADELFQNSSVSDRTWQALSGRLDMFGMLDAVMIVSEFTSLGTIYNALGIQPDAKSPDRLPSDVSYRVQAGPREPPLRRARIEPLPGTGLGIARTFQHYPKMAGPRSTGSNYILRGSSLSPQNRELLILRIGWNCQSEYEWAQHVGSVGRAREIGLPVERIAAGPSAAGWTAIERSLLIAADELYSDSTISDATWTALAQHFDTTSLMNIVVTVANYRMVSMALNAIGVQLDPGDEGFPK
jgi:alkylhydroperoxidase family enzyme